MMKKWNVSKLNFLACSIKIKKETKQVRKIKTSKQQEDKWTIKLTKQTKSNNKIEKKVMIYHKKN